MPVLSPGDEAPDFTLPATGGASVSLHDFRGRDVILYFYPKDDTPGCTTQACDLRDAYAEIERAGAVVLGVSPDNVASHDRFASKYGLPFPLLADTDHAVAEAYGAWGEKKMIGKKYMGIIRSTYLIGPDGKIKEVWSPVKPSDHIDDVVRTLGLAAASRTT
jgi:peroxiredoxin Q/BCP